MGKHQPARNLTDNECDMLRAALTGQGVSLIPLDRMARAKVLSREVTGPSQVFQAYGSLAAQVLVNPFSYRVADDKLERHTSAYSAMRKMRDEDPFIYSLHGISGEAVLALPDSLEPAEGGEAEFKFIAEWLEAYPDEWDTARRLIVEAVGFGFQVAENIYEDAPGPSGMGWMWPCRVAERPQEYFGYNAEGDLVIAGKVADLSFGDKLAPEKFFGITYHSTDIKPYGCGYFEACFWPWVLKRAGQALWGDYLDRFAHGIIHGQADNDADRQAIDQFILNLGRKRGVTTDLKAQIKALSTRSGGADVYREFVAYCDDKMSQAITGQTLMMAESQFGTRAQAETHAGSFGLRTMERARYLQSRANAFLNDILSVNWNNPRTPLYKIDYQPAEDLAARIAVDQALWTMGVAIDPDYWYKVYGRPSPGTLSTPGASDEPQGAGAPPPEQAQAQARMRTTPAILSARTLYPVAALPGKPREVVTPAIKAEKVPTDWRLISPAVLRMSQRQNNRDLYERKLKQGRRIEDLLKTVESRGIEIARPALTSLQETIVGAVENAKNAKAADKELARLAENPPAPWAEPLAQSMMAAYALGFYSRGKEVQQRGLFAVSDAELVDRAAAGYNTWGDVVDAYAGKVPVEAEDFYAMEVDIRAQCFTIARTKDLAVIARMRDLIAQAEAEGMYWGEVVAQADAIYAAAGLAPLQPWHLNQVLRTNTSLTYGAATEEFTDDPAVEDVIEGYMTITAGDDLVRPNHAVLDGQIFTKETMDSSGLWKPLGFQCRCSDVLVFKGEGGKARNTVPAGGGYDKAPKGAPADFWGGRASDKLGRSLNLWVRPS